MEQQKNGETVRRCRRSGKHPRNDFNYVGDLVVSTFTSFFKTKFTFVSESILMWSPLVANTAAVPAPPPAAAPMAAPFPPPAIAPMAAPIAAPAPTLSASFFVPAAACAVKGSVVIAYVLPSLTNWVNTSDIAALPFTRPGSSTVTTRPRTFMPFGRTVFPLTTTDSATLAINVSPALLVSVPTASIIATVSVVPAGISTISGAGAADDFGA